MNEQKFIPKMTGFKATDKDMKCLGFQYELGKWYEHEGELGLCKSGFHFCIYLSGVFAYYDQLDARAFRVEAEDVLDIPFEPGADRKLVCRRIRFVEELTATGNSNTGDRNTGNRNTGNWNTGNRNTGDRNTGNWNTGNWNTGDRNTGNWNTGNWNTGNSNTGNWNTGDRNTGDRNTGNWNTGDYHAGYFCSKEETVKCFDKDTRLLRHAFEKEYGNLSYELGLLLLRESPIDFERFKKLPGITAKKLKALHQKHIDGRKAFKP